MRICGWKKTEPGGKEGSSKVIKVPSHLDIEGNEMADAVANKGVKKHGKKVRDQKEQEVAEVVREKRRKRQAEEEANTGVFKNTLPKKFPPEKTDVMPMGKRSRPNSAYREVGRQNEVEVVGLAAMGQIRHPPRSYVSASSVPPC